MSDPKDHAPDPSTPRADTDPALADTDPGHATVVPPRTTTYPPDRWQSDQAVFTSAEPVSARDATADGERLTEAQARTILDARFRAAGAQLQADYPFREEDLMVTLDGFDPARRLGYAFLSHADADVVTDFDPAAEVAFDQLARDNRAFVLIVHDSDVPTPDALERRIDAFFDQMMSWNEDTQQF